MKRYLVTGRLIYRGHLPGSTFEADIGPNAEARAIARGAIRVVETEVATLRPGSYTPPAGWPTKAHT